MINAGTVTNMVIGKISVKKDESQSQVAQSLRVTGTLSTNELSTQIRRLFFIVGIHEVEL